MVDSRPQKLGGCFTQGENGSLIYQIKLEIKEEIVDPEEVIHNTSLDEDMQGDLTLVEKDSEDKDVDLTIFDEDLEEIEESFKEEIIREQKMEESTKNKKDGKICKICDKEFNYPSALKRHMVSHTDDKSFKCNICENKAYGSQSHLERHIMHTHTKEKNYKCSLCNAKFYSHSHLLRHQRSHMKEKPFGCDVCGRRFLEKFNLSAHMRIHNEEYPYKCGYCDKKFRAPNSLK